MDLRQSNEYCKYLELQGWKIEECRSLSSERVFKVFIKKIPLVPWSVMKMQRFEEEPDWEELKGIRNEHGVIYSVLEPLNEEAINQERYKKNRYFLSKGPYLPTKTLVVNLKKKEKELWSELSKDARQVIKKVQREGIEIKEIKKEKPFWQGWKKWGKGCISSVESLEKLVRSFRQKVLMLGAYRKSDLIGGSLILMVDNTAYYYYAWTSEEGKKLGAQYLLIWKDLLKMKREKLAKWDFDGIDDSRWSIKSWKGFSVFKKKFGGEEISYPGSWQRWL